MPWVSLGQFPTPVRPLEALGESLGLSGLWIKRDDMSSPDYGGNKVRKLEFLLADAKARGRSSVLTLGAVGSNHVLATTVHSKKPGLKNIAVFTPQPVQEYIRPNLLANFNLGCEMNYAASIPALPFKVMSVYLFHWLARDRSRPYFIWFGGSSALGVLGYVNCALEIAEQVKAGEMPEPDYIFCAVGSSGTFAGLWLGMKFAGLRTEVIGVRVLDKSGANEGIAARLARSSLKLLRKLDPSVPELKVESAGFNILHDYCGPGYARFTTECVEAVKAVKELEGIKLEGTYTGKAMAGLMGFAGKKSLRDETLLFINSYNSADISRYVNINPDYRRLPGVFHQFYEREIEKVEECQ